MIVDANVSDDELGMTQSHRDHYAAPVASRDSQRQGTVRRRVPHHLAIHILHDWSLLGAALQSCAFNDAYVSEVHVHACCTLSRAARAKEMLMQVEVSCAKHGAVASASPRDGNWQLQVHLLIARRAAQSDLTVRSWLATRLQLERRGFRHPLLHARTARRCVRARMRSPWTDGTAFGVEACRRRDLRLFVTYSQILCS